MTGTNAEPTAAQVNTRTVDRLPTARPRSARPKTIANANPPSAPQIAQTLTGVYGLSILFGKRMSARMWSRPTANGVQNRTQIAAIANAARSLETRPDMRASELMLGYYIERVTVDLREDCKLMTEQ